MAREQGAQDHDAAFFREDAGGRLAEFTQDEIGQAIKGDDLQARVAREIGIGEQLAFELEGGLFRGKQEQGRSFGPRRKFRPDRRETTVGLTAARRAEEKSYLHALY